MRFFQGVAHKEIKPNKEGSTVERYAWCLNQLYDNLQQNQSVDKKREGLRHFRDNMEKSEDTKKLFEQVMHSFLSFLDKEKSLPANDYIFNCFLGINIEGGYLSCEEESTVGFSH
ncbi:hypothetical protein Lmac_1582 [Legionella maceachernii]|uniref:Uncharacterized protein n=2 Tax=Legionellaceae TaxID=444 RepID=A0A0W0W0N4_9GAMM|nr:hypothetical protein Lmac_1582 [Legionella maceachernii]SJZ46026.1 hypothetical protein SAMN02745128_00086 [Legionella maceachernii]SUP04033.1 Uncharacterised protein [Legionella maceachernii]